MIIRLKLTNFQIHKTLDLNFTDGLNCILGHNNGGKSSIVRALNWLIYNAPAGDWMRHIDSKGVMCTTEVKLFFKDGTIIKRIKGDSINQYELDGETFDNFGFQVPQKVKDVLKIVPFITNKSQFNLNVSMQEDKPFLIHESAPVKASVIDKLTGTSVLQKAISDFNKESLAISKDITEKTNQIENDKNSLEEMPDTDRAKSLLNEAEILDESFETLHKQIEDLRDIAFKFKVCKKTLENINIPKIDDIKLMCIEYTKLEKELTSLQNYKTDRDKSIRSIINIPEFDSTKEIGTLNNMSADLKELQEFEKCLFSLKEIIESCSSIIVDDETWVKEYYEENPECPVCKGKWK